MLTISDKLELELKAKLFRGFADTEGIAELFVAVYGGSNFGLELPWRLHEMLAQLRLNLSLDLYYSWEEDE